MKIVLTGGPGAGKTAMLELLNQEFAEHVVPVAEAASMLFRGGFPRVNAPEHRRAQERAIFAVQRELERIAELEANGRFLLCDRGSLDVLGYWPGSPDDFFAETNTTLEAEMSRYRWVIHLESMRNTPCSLLRTENDEEACMIDRRLKDAYRFHPRRFILGTTSDYVTTMRETALVIDGIIRGLEKDEISEALTSFRGTTTLNQVLSTP